MTKPLNSKCGKTQNVLKINKNETKHKMSKCDNLKCDNSKCDRTQKPKMWQNSETKNVTKHKKNQNTNIKILNHDKILQLKLWQNSTAQIVTKLKNSILIKKKSEDFCWEQLNTSTTDEMYSRQQFVILQCCLKKGCQKH